MTPQGAAPKHRNRFLFPVSMIAVGWLCGCSTETGDRPWLVSKPNMQFSEARVFNAASRIGLHLESGRVVSGGAQASVCTSCR